MTLSAGSEDARTASADCILLAAGASRRMGRPKLHLPFGPSTVLGSTLAAALGAGLRVVVVGRPDDPLIGDYAIPGRVLIAINQDPDRGMLSSLQAGLDLAGAAPAREGGFFFLPGDMPLIRASTYERLLALEHRGALIASFNGRRGHPVLVPQALSEALRSLPIDGNLRAFIDGSHPLFVETGDEGTVRDIDLPGDYASASTPTPEGLSSSCIPRVGA